MIRILLLGLTMVTSLFAAEETLQFEVADGLEVRSAVEPGLVRHPVMATLDDSGRLFVAESAGLNLKKEELLEQLPNSIRLLEDTDNDGVYDAATTFADRLTFPQGAQWIYDSLYVMSPPSLWRFADRDGDGVAEEREELATGFDFTGNAASVHGPFLHPNGRLYWCHGRKSFAIPDNDTGEILTRGKGARIWSSTLSGSEIESFAGGGMDNPVEIDFTDEGEIIGTVNLFYGRPRGDTLTHWVHGGVYPRSDQEQAIDGLPRTGDLLPEVHNFGHAAVSGLCRYRSDRLNSEWKDQWIVAHFNSSRLTRTKLLRNGSGFRELETEEILRARNPDSHLTDILEDHNGDLLAIDTGGWFRIGCPTSHIAKPEVPGGIYRISPVGMPYQKPAYPDWESMTSEAVSVLLDADEPWLRDRAGLELAGRGDPAIPELKRILGSESSSSIAKKNAIWTLTKLRFSESTDLILAALKDRDSGVRQTACHAISVTRTWQSIAANEPAEREFELERNRTISGALSSLVRGDEPFVARQAAVALGRMAEYRSIGDLIGRLGRAQKDRMLKHSLIFALIEIDDPETTRTGLDSENPAILSGTLRAIHEMPSGDLTVFDILPHLDSDNSDLRETAVSIASETPEWDAALANLFFSWEDLNEPRLRTIASIVGDFANLPPIQDFLTSLLNSSSETDQLRALQFLTEAENLKVPPAWDTAFSTFLSPDNPNELRNLALNVVASSPGNRFAEELEALANDQRLTEHIRLRAARGLTSQDTALSQTSFDLLLKILGANSDATIRAEAVSILSQSQLTTEQRLSLATIADQISPHEIPALMQVFRTLRSRDEASALATSLAKSPAFTSFEMERLEQIFRPFPEVFASTLEGIIQQARQEDQNREEKIESLLNQLKDADPGAGQAVFRSGKGSCMVCHKIGESGGSIGPNLSTIGSIRTGKDLLESVLYPNESIARDFNAYELRIRGGVAPMIGVIESETVDSIKLLDTIGHMHRIEKDDIESMIELSDSLMPPGLDQTMNDDELRDLVSYLLSLR